MTRLGDVVDMTFGFAFKSKEFSVVGSDIRLLRGDNIAQGSLRWNGAKRLPTMRSEDFEHYQLAVGDVVLAMDRPWIEAGLKYAVVREADLPSLLVQRVARLRAREPLEQGFLGNVVGSRAFTDYVIGVQTGSAVPHISGTQIAEFEFPTLPPIAEQRGIAATLGALDDKIESNGMAHKIIWNLLGTEFDRAAVDSPGVELRSLLRLEYGKPLPATSRVPGPVPVFGSNGVTGSHDAALIDGPGVIVGRKGSIGEVHWSDRPCFPIDTTYFVVPVDGYPLLACYFALMNAGLKDKNSDSAIPGLNRESALSTYVAAPGLTTARRCAENCKGFLDQLVHLNRESANLKCLRDALLPELLSGRIRVPEAREAVEATQ